MKKQLLMIAGLALAGIAGAQKSPLWTRYCALSPDGSTIAFCYKGDIYTVSPQGVVPSRPTEAPSLFAIRAIFIRFLRKEGKPCN